MAHSDYTAAEVEECLEAQTAINPGNKVGQEQANRLVRSVGTVAGQGLAGASLGFNDGKPVKTKLNWHMAIGDALNVWIRNGSQVVYTTGSALRVQGTIWIKDSV